MACDLFLLLASRSLNSCKQSSYSGLTIGGNVFLPFNKLHQVKFDAIFDCSRSCMVLVVIAKVSSFRRKLRLLYIQIFLPCLIFTTFQRIPPHFKCSWWRFLRDFKSINAWVNENPDPPTPRQGGFLEKNLSQISNNTPTPGDASLGQNIT